MSTCDLSLTFCPLTFALISESTSPIFAHFSSQLEANWISFHLPRSGFCWYALIWFHSALTTSQLSRIPGNAANYAETEQILILPEKNGGRSKIVSFLQTRGSIPLLWAQVCVLNLSIEILAS